jgi:hypothetical protein
VRVTLPRCVRRYVPSVGSSTHRYREALEVLVVIAVGRVRDRIAARLFGTGDTPPEHGSTP